MKFVTTVIVTSILLIIASMLLQEYMPAQIVMLMKYPAFKDLSNVIHRVFKIPLRYLYKSQQQTKPKKKAAKEKLFTAEDLKKYDGKKGSKGVYLAILGRVYDVRKGMQYYGPGGGYEFFTGRDGSRAFVSGDFTEEGLIDDISNLSSQDYLGLEEWDKFYNKDYKYVGKLIGRFYDEQGAPTPYNLEVQSWIGEAHSQKDKEDKERMMFPPCNSEWTPETGTRLYCTKRSGGMEREWVGVPRKLFRPGTSQERCACIKNYGPPSHDPTREPHQDRGDLDNPSLREYPNCEPHKVECRLPID